MITPVKGVHFIQLKFDSQTGGTWMSDELDFREIRLTAVPGKLAADDFIAFAEAHVGQPQIFILSNEAKATQLRCRTNLMITDYKLTNPTDVVLSLELGT